MKIQINVRAPGLALSILFLTLGATAEDFTNAINAYLQHRGEMEKRPGCIVVGLIDEHGTRYVSYGTLDNDSGQIVDENTIFGIHSETCVYTALLFEDMVEKGELKPNDPVAKYLPKEVIMPTRKRHQITLQELEMEAAGLPSFAERLQPRDPNNPMADYTIDKMYGFLSSYQLSRNPGDQFEHGGIAMALLGHVMEMRAGTNFESLMVDRILQPLGMDNTRFTLTPKSKTALAIEHSPSGKPKPATEWAALAPLAGLRSSASDLLKFVSVNLGLTQSSLLPLLQKHLAHFPWLIPGEENQAIIQMGGGGMFNTAYCGFDRSQRRGLVVLSTSDDGRYNALAIGRFLLEGCEWSKDQRPTSSNADIRHYSRYIGKFETKSNSVAPPSKVEIRETGNRLFIDVIGPRPGPIDLIVPPGMGELLPQSDTTFFERLSGATILFTFKESKVNGLTLRYGNKVIPYAKITVNESTGE